MLSVQHISKVFPGVKALDDVSIEFQPGTCHALMGENGAGKSTLGKIIAGLYQPDGGEIQFEGNKVRFKGPQDAVAAGISIVHQELLFCENLTVADNLCLGELPQKGLWINEQEMNRRASEWLGQIGSTIDPTTLVGSLPVSQQQIVQIAGAIGREAKVLIFDEPSSSLSIAETQKLLDLIRELKKSGVLCIYVSHRLEEIFAVCDMVSVLRDGSHVATHPVADITRADLVRLMVGRDVEPDSFSAETTQGETLLEVKDLRIPSKVRGINFEVRAGEIVGLAGLVGAGRTETVEAIFGLNALATGTITSQGIEQVLPYSPQAAMQAKLGLVPEDRKRHGIVLGLSERHNVALPILDLLQRLGFITPAREAEVVNQYHDRMKVKSPSIESVVGGLSGGNQQKVVLAKWLAANCEILMVDEPTRGVDVGAKAEIHDLLREVAAAGKAVLVVSSDMPELLAISTRILVMRDGQLVTELPGGSSEQEVMAYMAGAETSQSTKTEAK